MSLSILIEAERDLILPWRNAPAVRQAMYTSHEITVEEHCAWFQRMQADPGSYWYLYRDNTNTPKGVVYFTGVDSKQRSAFWGFYASPEAAPGTGLCMEFEAIEMAFNDLGLHKLNCEVLGNNKSVINLHKKVGFPQEGAFREQHFDGKRRIDVVRFGMLASEWPQYREQLRERIAALATHTAQGHR